MASYPITTCILSIFFLQNVNSLGWEACTVDSALRTMPSVEQCSQSINICWMYKHSDHLPSPAGLCADLMVTHSCFYYSLLDHTTSRKNLIIKTVQTSIPCFFVLCFIAICKFVFEKLKVCGNPAWNKYDDTIFPKAFFHSMCHILVVLTIFETFSLLLCLL